MALTQTVDSLSRAGALAQANGDYSEALKLFLQALALESYRADLHNNVGVMYGALGDEENALSSYLKALSLKPQYVQATYNAANCLKRCDRTEEAIQYYRKAVALDSKHVDAHYNLANLLRSEGLHDEAVNTYQSLLAVQDHVPGMVNLGGVLIALNRLEEAIHFERRALAIDANNARAHWNLALALLASADYEQGWREYEWRLSDKKVYPKVYQARGLWDGSPLEGRTLLIRSEQGLGDNIQFCRYVALLAQRGAKIVFECRPELYTLLLSQKWDVQCVLQGEPLPEFDTFVYLMSLPYLCQTTMANIPATTPYLTPDPALAAEWAGHFNESKGGLKVGIVWAGSPGYQNDGIRSMPLEMLAPLAEMSGLDLYSLQMGPGRGELAIEAWAGKVRDLARSIQSFADTAAILAHLDLVVTVDTAVVHLAGAMGKRVCLMLPWSCDWRWQSDRSDSPWYPTLTLYRQKTAGNWSEVVRAIVNDLTPKQVMGNMDEMFRKANQLQARGEHLLAIEAYCRMLEFWPGSAEIYNNLGMSLQDTGQMGEAAAAYRQAFALMPMAKIQNNLGTVYVSQGKRQEAIQCFQKTVQIDNSFVPAYINLGACLQYLQRPQEALAVYHRALEVDADSVEARINLGTVYQQLMLPQKAIEVYEEALVLDPGSAKAHWNLALSLLANGDFERGWSEYEWRFIEDPACCPTSGPLWAGCPLDGRTILIECEQGLGDTLQFVRYADLVADQGGRVFLCCQSSSLKALLKRVPGVSGVVVKGSPEADSLKYDCTIPLMSLPHIFGTTLEDLPIASPYLRVDPVLKQFWHSRMAFAPGLKVGLVWKGGPEPQNRKMEFNDLVPLAKLTGATFFSLQLGEAPRQDVFPVINLAPSIKDFADTAAMVSNLDLVITIDTAVAHLAGGLGVPVWTLLPWSSDWRWMVGCDKSPWYPSMHLFRQKKTGDWSEVVTEVVTALERMRIVGH